MALRFDSSRYGKGAVAVVGICAVFAVTMIGSSASAEAPSSPQAEAAGNAKRSRAVARMERGIRQCANSRRTAAGMKPLAVGTQLGEAARYHAQKMAKAPFFSHVDPSGRGPADRIALFAGSGAFTATGENIAAGQRSAGGVCRAWMGSSGHRANILNGAFTHVGGGFAFGGPYGRYYVMELGRAR
jgi:uncharacterized protein YkwD